MLFSKAREYGRQVVLHLAAKPRADFVTVRELAQDCEIPLHSLSHVVGRLAHAGILHSSKGPAKGIGPAHPSTEITLLEVMQGIAGPDGFDRYVPGPEPHRGNKR